MHLLVGLGNNGLNYARHRHNVGRMVLDSLSDCLERGPWQSLGHGRLTAVSEDCLLLVPTTAMNVTGAAVEEVCALHGIPPGNVCVFHDDMDIPVGTVMSRLNRARTALREAYEAAERRRGGDRLPFRRAIGE